METEQLFGGDWTEEKLRVLDRYLHAYAQALKNKSFELLYIDAFAGTGYREQRIVASTTTIFDEVAADNSQQFLDGSAKIALRCEPSFHRYVFVEMRKGKVAELEQLKLAFPSKAPRIQVICSDANEAVTELCAGMTPNQRGVLFLDPIWDAGELEHHRSCGCD